MDELINRMEAKENIVSEQEVRTIEVISLEKQKENRLKQTNKKTPEPQEPM